MLSEEDRKEIAGIVREEIDKKSREIIETAKQESLLALPTAFANLMKNHIDQANMKNDLLKEHKEFKKHPEAVASVMDKVDGDFPHLPYSEKAAKAIPQIYDRIQTEKSLSMERSG